MNTIQLEKIARQIRRNILAMSTSAGSGHPTSSLSAADLMAGLFFGGFFRFDVRNPQNPNNDRLIFSKGHASPLFYSLWVAAGALPERELFDFRKFGSRLEGHPALAFPYTEAATGSLGQGLSIGFGMALAGKYLDHLPYRTYVLLGDSEMAEGSCWEAMQLASYYRLDNLIAIVDVNRLGQRGQTMAGWDMRSYKRKAEAFGWQAIIINGHDFKDIVSACSIAAKSSGKPIMILARTIKGRGVDFLENKDGWHGKVLKPDDLEHALSALEPANPKAVGKLAAPKKAKGRTAKQKNSGKTHAPGYKQGDSVATRQAYGSALARLALLYRDMVVLDAEVCNSTYAEDFKKEAPERFFEMFIAEQNMVGAAVGLSRRGKIPFVSTFSAFLTRAFDQIRMSQYSGTNIKFAGSHAGVSIGEDGASQMGLEDMAMFRTLFSCPVLYPSDAVSCERLVEETMLYPGNTYLRTTRMATPVIYDPSERFPIGGSKTLRKSSHDVITIVAAGITLHQALVAHQELKELGIFTRVIDVYSVKPIDQAALIRAVRETDAIIVAEDHVAEGGLADAVREALSSTAATIYSLAVRLPPKSGKPLELLDYEGISARAIVRQVRAILR